MRFEIAIDCNNASFFDGSGSRVGGEHDKWVRANELSRILKKVMLEVGAEQQGGICLDVNGNRVGQWAITHD